MKTGADINVFLKCLSCGSFLISPSFAVIKKHFENCQLKKSGTFSTSRYSEENDNDDFDDFIDNKTETVTFTQPSLVLQRYCNLNRSKARESKPKQELQENGDSDDTSHVVDPCGSDFAGRKRCQNELLQPPPKMSRLELVNKPKHFIATPKNSTKAVSIGKRNKALETRLVHKKNPDSRAQTLADELYKVTDSKFQCQYNCSTRSDSIQELVAHFKSAHQEKHFKPKKTIKSGEFTTDKRGNKLQKCEYCGLFFKVLYLPSHRSKVHPDGAVKPENTFICPYPGCKVKLKYAHVLKRHFVLHLENNPYACNFPRCNVKSNSLSTLKRHMVVQHFEPPPICTKCGVTYTNAERLKRHGCEANVQKMQSGHFKLVEINGFWKIKPKSFININVRTNSMPDPSYLSTWADKHEINDKVNRYIDSLKVVDINAVIRSESVFIEACKISPGFDKLLFGDERSNKFRVIETQRKQSGIFKCSRCLTMITGLQSYLEHNTQCNGRSGESGQLNSKKKLVYNKNTKVFQNKGELETSEFTDNDDQAMVDWWKSKLSLS